MTSKAQGILAPWETLHAAVHQKNIPGLDAMRASAIVLVIVYHFGRPITAAIGVIVFFVLSGFLITGILIKELMGSGTISIRSFYSRRAYRIFPAFYVCWFITMGLAWWRHNLLTWPHTLQTFFYLADYGRALIPLHAQYQYQMGISWSLAVEEQFYLLWPLLLLKIYKMKNPVRTVGWIICGLWLWRAVLVIGFHVSWDYAYNAFDTRADALMIGCWLALAVFRPQGPRLVSFWLHSKWLMLIPFAVLYVINTLEMRQLVGPRLMVLEFSLDPLLTAIILLQWIYWGSLGWAFLEHPLIKFTARISYSLYLYHQVVKSLHPRVLQLVPTHTGKTMAYIVGFTLVAMASYYGIERPFMRMRDRGRRASVLMDDGMKHTA